MKIGANYLGDSKCEFRVWAPFLKDVKLKFIAPKKKPLPMQKDANGYWQVRAEGIAPGTQYFFDLNDTVDRPDPASHFQPQGVHGPSEVVDHHSFQWTDSDWRNIPLDQLIIYELHVGVFSRTGTFEAIIPRLDELKNIGINALEIMPVAQFPGKRNWGYDGVYPYAVQNSYGGPTMLKKLVNACHRKRLAVILDVVYNHLGPEGNYLSDYASYFTDKYKTPWGNAINFDDAYSDEVRNYFIENALHWFENYHIDALRLDAIHTIYDMSAYHFLAELADRVKEFSQQQGREFYLIAESDLNDARIIQPREIGGYGIHAQWSDDFHHSVHTLLTGEQSGYYIDFGKLEHLAKAINNGFVLDGEYSEYRKRRHGNSARERPPLQFVICIQNHDQVGNRMLGERLSQLVSFEALKLAAGILILSPGIPLLFMGEEYGEEAPFLYFVDHSDSDLIKAVQEGRKAEFSKFKWQGEPPDPQSRETFEKCILNWEKRGGARHGILLNLYRELIRLRRIHPALHNLKERNFRARGDEANKVLYLHRWAAQQQIFCLFNFNQGEVAIQPSLPAGDWRKIFDSAEEQWGGATSNLPAKLKSEQSLTILPYSFAVYEKSGK